MQILNFVLYTRFEKKLYRYWYIDFSYLKENFLSHKINPKILALSNEVNLSFYKTKKYNIS